MSILERVRVGRQERAELRALLVCPSCDHVSAGHEDGFCATSFDMRFGDEQACECTSAVHGSHVTQVVLYAD